ncbi:hypothetical protein GQ53DRAFT_122025 [Thozetella sp. PMI_491]|nr:hypothetical protein GQ53DRAFT_122025 [Thozetella sp. PMI_491]
MAAQDAASIEDPNQIQELHLSVALSNLTIESPGPSSLPQSEVRQVNIALLQPLATPSMLQACRSPSLPTAQSASGSRLDISALSKAWRQALSKVAPLPWIKFDLALPRSYIDDQRDNRTGSESKGGESSQSIYWDSDTRQRGQDQLIPTRDVMVMIATIATAMRMRASGEVRFEVVYDEAEGVSPRAMKQLKSQLQAIAGVGISEEPVSRPTCQPPTPLNRPPQIHTSHMDHI